MRLSWLADALRAEGLEVIELDGWQTRGGPLTKVEGVVCHGTITPASTPDANVARLLRDGHSTLAGPLSQIGLDRQGRVWLVAAGRCNHNGFGEWGNQAVGIEAFHDGKEQWSGVQLRAWEKTCAAICRRLSLPCERVKGHKETDPKRKVDPGGLNMDHFRQNIAGLLAPARPPLAAPTVTDYPEATVKRIDVQIDTDAEGRGYRDITASPREVVSVIANTANPPDQGYKPIPDVARLDVGGRTRIVVEEAVPNGRIDVAVWVAA